MKALPHFAPATSHNSPTIPPPPEHGVNLWILSVARFCQLAEYPQAQAFETITAHAGHLRPGRQLLRSEVERATRTAYGTAHQAGSGAPKPKALPSHELDKLCPPISEEAAQDFVSSSPIDRKMPTAEILALLFRPDEFLALKPVNQCSPERCQVKNLTEFFARAGKPYQFVSSSPITGRFGVTQDGKLSFGALECFTSQRYVVVEFDDVTPRSQFARLLWLKEKAGQHAPLVMMLKSGSRSIHAWYLPSSPDTADQLKAAAVKLGADPAALRIHQSVRSPNQTRDNGNLQEVLWLAAPSIPF